MFNELPYVIEVKAGPAPLCGPRPSTILAAHLGVEQATIFARLLWRRSALIVMAAAMLEYVRIIPPIALLATVLLFSTLALGASWTEWRTRARFRSLLDARSN